MKTQGSIYLRLVSLHSPLSDIGEDTEPATI